jgi:hypothetical protein
MVLRGRFRQYWKAWLALGLLVAVAVAGGFVLTTASAGRRTRSPGSRRGTATTPSRTARSRSRS